jgi:hypothetical protein
MIVHVQPVRCVETGQEFPSAAAAARSVGRAGSNILDAIRRGGTCRGFHWEAAGPPAPMEVNGDPKWGRGRKPSNRKTKTVIRSDGATYASAEEAASANELHLRTITRAIQQGTLCRGHFWFYEGDPDAV